jgi:ABC-2 type transport system permease protein
MKLRNMFNLVRNENMKLSKRLSTWIMIGILILVVIIAGGITKHNANKAGTKNWKTEMTMTNQSLKMAIAQHQGMPQNEVNRMKLEIETNEYHLAHNLPPVEDATLWGFIESMSNLIIIISLFAIVLGGGMIATEFSEGTIKLLLIRPSKRWKILLSKYISVLFYILLMLGILFAASFIIGGTLFSFAGVNLPYVNNASGHITEISMISHILVVYGYACVNLIMMVTLAFMISSVFRSSSLAIGVGVFLMFVGNLLVSLLSQFNWSKYILFANIDLKQYSAGTPPVAGMTLNFSIIVLIVYFIEFNLISFVGFSKRSVAA